MSSRPGPQLDHYDCVIIGGGMSGLAAGIRLAYYEKKVCILDRHTMPGGLNSFYTIDGRKFDVGLHAMTNYVARDVRSAPLNKLLRQLRIPYEDFQLCPQGYSDVRFPGRRLRFSNDFSLFESEVCAAFPHQADAFRKLVAHIKAYNELDLNARPLSTRRVIVDFLSDPILIDMILCPLMYYGSADEHDMEFGQFVIMFKSIFLEGFSRPRDGVRVIISTLIRKYKECKGELCMGTGVKRLGVKDGALNEIELDDGRIITADRVLSSAGWIETMQLTDDSPIRSSRILEDEGRMTFVESISVLDCEPKALGFDQTITFYNNADRFHYTEPQEAVDVNSAVVCVPNNFQYAEPLEEGFVRITHMANYKFWKNADAATYPSQKKEWYDKSLKAAAEFVPEFRSHVKFVDTFTPRTIHKFTNHWNGAVYGSPHKLKDGRTPVKNLYLIGTDQGFLGIVGALLSGISMANLHVLQAQ
jgi:phytoene dehydrogenase-like protein